MYVRLGFSVAINVNPDVLLVDEVLAVGDESFQRRCLEKFADLQKAGRTIVIVSHALGTVRAMCDRLAWLDKGVLRAVGPAKDVIDEYLGEVHIDQLRDAVSGRGRRWGSGEGVIEAVELINGVTGRSSVRVRTGEPVTLRFHYRVVGAPIPEPTIGFALHRIDGVHVSGVNIREQGMAPPLLSGRGHFDYVIDRLPLLPSTYDLTVALQDKGCTHDYDWWENGFRFEVDPAIGLPVHETEGVLTFLGRWEHPET